MPVNIWCGIRVACTNDWTPSTYSQQAPQPIQITDDFLLTPLIPSIFIGSNFDLTSNQTYPPHSRKVGEVKYQFLIPQ